jgi:hypothetical protein
MWRRLIFIARHAGKGYRTKQPDWKTIFASYSDGLGVLRNLNLQRTITSKRFREVFPFLLIGHRFHEGLAQPQ